MGKGEILAVWVHTGGEAGKPKVKKGKGSGENNGEKGVAGGQSGFRLETIRGEGKGNKTLVISLRVFHKRREVVLSFSGGGPDTSCRPIKGEKEKRPGMVGLEQWEQSNVKGRRGRATIKRGLGETRNGLFGP